MPAPEQARNLLLAVTEIRAMIKKAQCSAMITIAAGDLPLLERNFASVAQYVVWSGGLREA